MTTTVNIGLRKPNHLKAIVRAHVRNPDGSIGQALNSVVIDHDEETTNYVHSGQVIVIEEFDEAANLPAPVGSEIDDAASVNHEPEAAPIAESGPVSA